MTVSACVNLRRPPTAEGGSTELAWMEGEHWISAVGPPIPYKWTIENYLDVSPPYKLYRVYSSWQPMNIEDLCSLIMHGVKTDRKIWLFDVFGRLVFVPNQRVTNAAWGMSPDLWAWSLATQHATKDLIPL